MKTKLSFAMGNSKVSKSTALFSLPAGFTCPGALQCLSKANRQTGTITDGPHTEFRCYAASAEALFKNIRESRWNNFEALRGLSAAAMAELILQSIPGKATMVRMHQSGDFFNQTYFDAWVLVASRRPDLVFYGYTKALPFWVSRVGQLPRNFRLVASRGGRFDDMIAKHGLRSVRVVFSESEARKAKLKIDHDDSLVWNYGKDFAILLYGTQPKGSLAGKAWQLIKSTVGGYKANYFKSARN